MDDSRAIGQLRPLSVDGSLLDGRSEAQALGQDQDADVGVVARLLTVLGVVAVVFQVDDDSSAVAVGGSGTDATAAGADIPKG